MRLVLLFLVLFACTKEDNCQSCYTIAYSNENKVCGRENNGFEEVAREGIGRHCDDGDLDDFRAKTEKTMTVPSVKCLGRNYTLQIKVECQT